MLGISRLRVVYLCRFDELAPRLMREERERAQLSAGLKVCKNFTRNPLLVLITRIITNLRAVLNERLLRIGRIAVDQPDKLNQLIPRFPVSASILPRVNRLQLPLFLPGQRLNCLRQTRRQSLQLLRAAFRNAAFPQIRTQLQFFHAQPVSFVERSFELLRPRQIVKFWQVSRKLDLILARKGSVRSIQIGQFTWSKRERSNCRDRAWNPPERLFFLRHIPRSIRRRQRLARNDDVAVFVRPRLGKLLADLLQFLQNVAAFRFQSLRFQLQRNRVGARQPFSDGADRAFQLLPAFQIVLQQAHAQRAELRHDVVPHHAQCLGRLAGYQHTLALCQQMPDQIADCVRLAGAWRALYQYSPVQFQLLRNSNLFRVRGLTQQNFSRSFGRLNYGWLHLLRHTIRGFFADDVQERPRQIFPRAQVRQDALNGSRESQGTRTQKYKRVAADARVTLLFSGRLILKELSPRR